MPPAEQPPLLEFRDVMRRLRAECPWKREQTHRSLARYLLEETHETLEVLDEPLDGPLDDAHLAEELGDLLLQVYFHAAIAEERGAFDIDDVARAVTAKMRRRNPHVFGPATAAEPLDAASVDAAWQAIKAEEQPVPAPLPPTLPALLLAAKTLERRARAGRSTPAVLDVAAVADPAAVAAVADGAAGAAVAAPGDLGERLLALVAEANAAGVDPEQALRDAVRRTSDD